MATENLLADVRSRLRARVSGPDATFGFVIGGQLFELRIRECAVSITGVPFLTPQRDATITMTEDVLRGLMAGEINPTMGLLSGKFKVEGNMTAARRIGDLFS